MFISDNTSEDCYYPIRRNVNPDVLNIFLHHQELAVELSGQAEFGS